MPVQKRKTHRNHSGSLPPIPEKLYFTIGEVATLCDLKPHVLRYWEQEFPVLSPAKRRGNRRYYQREEVLLVRRIRALLYEEGYTIEGAKHCLAERIAVMPSLNIDLQALQVVIQQLEQVATQLETSQ